MCTKGKVVSYFNVGSKKYIKYLFYVKNIKYYNETKVYPFKCKDGTNGCVGKKFTVVYSELDPSNCEINLGIYEKHRPNRLRLFNLD